MLASRSIHDIKVPDFSHYMRPGGEHAATEGRTVGYLMLGSAAAGTGLSARHVVAEFLDSMNPAAHVRALANIEVDISVIPEGGR